MSAMPPFHLAFPVLDLDATERFYVEALGCSVGRRDARWIDLDFLGHQLSAHLVDAPSDTEHNEVDGDQVPVRHFGAVLPWERWEAMAARLRERGVPFLIEPHVRFAGQVGEQGTLFVLDPSGNAIELKSFKDPSKLFAR